MRAVLERYEAAFVLSAGVAGALDPDLRAGDLLLCETVVSDPDPQPPAVRSDARLLEAAASAAARAGLRARRGRSLTVNRIVSDPAAKAGLRLRLPLLLRLARCQRRAVETLGLFLEAFTGALPPLPVAGAKPA